MTSTVSNQDQSDGEPLTTPVRAHVDRVLKDTRRLDRLLGVTFVVAICSAPTIALAEETKVACVDANTEAQELRRTGKLSSARKELRRCADAACPQIVSDDCTRRLDELDKAQPTIAFDVRDATGGDVTGIQISVDGSPFASNAPGVAVEVDPGEHTFVFEAPGLPRTVKKLVVVEGVKGRHEVVVVGGDVAPATKAESGGPSSTGPGRPPTLSWVSFGVGVAGLAVGIGAGFSASSKHDTLVSNCPGNVCPTSENGDLDAFHALRTWSTVGYVVGALGVAGGATLWLMAPRRSGLASAHVWLGPGSAGIRGHF